MSTGKKILVLHGPKLNLLKIIPFFFLIGILLGGYVFLEPFFLEEKYIALQNPNIPPEFQDTRVVFLTDIHHGPYFSQMRLEKLVNRVNGLQPDIILLGGDYVHRSPNYIKPCFGALMNLEATLGVYGVLGNHDHWEDAALTRQCMEAAGIHLIDNEAYWVEKNGGRIKIGGVGDYMEDIQDIEPTIADINNDDFVLLVTHNPDYVKEMSTEKVDLVFAGHTHGGQVTFLGLWAPLSPSKYGQNLERVLWGSWCRSHRIKRSRDHNPTGEVFARPQIIIVDLGT